MRRGLGLEMLGILKLAYKLLVNDRAKFTALLVGITFAVFLMVMMTSMFAGLLNRSSATVIGIARAAYFPNVVLTATGGLESLSFADWFTWPSRFWSVGPAAAETIFDTGARKAQVQQAVALHDASVANYRQTVLTSFQQVEDNLAALRILAENLQQQNAAVQSARRFLDQATTRNTAGLDPFLNVLVAQVSLLTYQQTYVNFQTQQMIASVQLIEALGGGWDASLMPTPAQARAKLP
jgi:outer membrane protein TolC